MKIRSLFSALLFFAATSGFAQTGHEGHNHGDEGHNHGTQVSEPAQIQSSFKWDEAVHDFGKIKQGVPATATFTFTNIGTQPIVITEAKASCGCTVPEFSKTPVAPGAKGTVTATYNAANAGIFDKDVTVISNASAVDVKLKIKGEVVAE
jgi:hypothetical protein